MGYPYLRLVELKIVQQSVCVGDDINQVTVGPCCHVHQYHTDVEDPKELWSTTIEYYERE